jgi:hypothetical protein
MDKHGEIRVEKSTEGFIFKNVLGFHCGSHNSRSRGRLDKNSKPTPPTGIRCVA